MFFIRMNFVWYIFYCTAFHYAILCINCYNVIVLRISDYIVYYFIKTDIIYFNQFYSDVSYYVSNKLIKVIHLYFVDYTYNML